MKFQRKSVPTSFIHSFIHAFFVTDAKDSAAGEPMEVDNSESVTASEETTPEQSHVISIIYKKLNQLFNTGH